MKLSQYVFGVRFYLRHTVLTRK